MKMNSVETQQLEDSINQLVGGSIPIRQLTKALQFVSKTQQTTTIKLLLHLLNNHQQDYQTQLLNAHQLYSHSQLNAYQAKLNIDLKKQDGKQNEFVIKFQINNKFLRLRIEKRLDKLLSQESLTDPTIVGLLFELLDSDKDGLISREDFKNYLSSIGQTLSQTEIHSFFELMTPQGTHLRKQQFNIILSHL